MRPSHMTFRHDVKRFWTNYHRMKNALEKIAALEGPAGKAARAGALEVLKGGACPDDLPPEAAKLLVEVFAGLDGAERAVCGPVSEGGNPGSPSDAATDERNLEELVSEWKARLQPN